VDHDEQTREAEEQRLRENRERIQRMVEEWDREVAILPLMIAPRQPYLHTTYPRQQHNDE
jgi:hypothetical protein